MKVTPTQEIPYPEPGDAADVPGALKRMAEKLDVILAAGGRGQNGDNGAQGAQGTQGTQGVQGAQGNQGAQGPGVGAQGSQGHQGTQGAQGTQGVQGAGVQGVQGAVGAQGTQGTQGSQGTQGLRGFQGFQGYQGFQGTVGATGPQGTQGVQGVSGAVVMGSAQNSAEGALTATASITNASSTRYMVVIVYVEWRVSVTVTAGYGSFGGFYTQSYCASTYAGGHGMNHPFSPTADVSSTMTQTGFGTYTIAPGASLTETGYFTALPSGYLGADVIVKLVGYNV